MPQSEFVSAFLLQTPSLSCSLLTVSFVFFFFLNLPKQVVFSFMFGSILSPNSPIYFIFQLIQTISCFIVVVVCCFHKGHLDKWLYTSAFHFFFTFWISLCGHCSGEHFCGFSTSAMIMCWYLCSELQLNSLLWILISWCVLLHACVFVYIYIYMLFVPGNKLIA